MGTGPMGLCGVPLSTSSRVPTGLCWPKPSSPGMRPWSLGLSLGLWVSLPAYLCCLRGFVWICVSVSNVLLSVFLCGWCRSRFPSLGRWTRVQWSPGQAQGSQPRTVWPLERNRVERGGGRGAQLHRPPGSPAQTCAYIARVPQQCPVDPSPHPPSPSLPYGGSARPDFPLLRPLPEGELLRGTSSPPPAPADAHVLGGGVSWGGICS